MSGEPKFYSVSELADNLKLARTTVNDWISRYSQYIDFEMQGRRKIYPESTLNVMKEISELRDSGMSSFDIETELAKRHPVHGEVDTGDNPQSDTSEKKREPGTDEFGLVAKHQTTEVATLISDQLKLMALKMEDIEKSNTEISTRSWRWFWLSIFIFIALIAVTALSAYKLQEFLDANKTLSVKNTKLTAEGRKTYENLMRNRLMLKAKQQEVESISSVLDRKTQEYHRKSTNLQRQYHSRETEYEKLLNKTREDAKRKHQEALLAIREEYAKKRLDLIKQLEKTISEGKNKDSIIEKLQQQNLEQSQALKKLAERLSAEAKAVPETEKPAAKTGTSEIKAEKSVKKPAETEKPKQASE